MPGSRSVPLENLLESIPDPVIIRSRLVKSIQHVALLRALLRVAERKADYEKRAAAGGEASSA